MTTKDYTHLPLGLETENGVIAECPCGKRGLKETVYGVDHFTHMETLSGNPPAYSYEMCPRQKPV